MAFATDRDVLALEPHAYRDLVFVGQVVQSGVASTTGNALEMADFSVDFFQARVAPGHVLMAQGLPLEVISVDGSNEATVSLLRPTADGPIIEPPKLTGAAAYVMTLGPQLELAHRSVLRMAGIDPDAAPGQGALTAAAVTNPGAMRRLEALGALHLAWAAAGATQGDDAPANERAARYRRRFADERSRAAVEIDLDADGRPDVLRRLNATVLMRRIDARAEVCDADPESRGCDFGDEAWSNIESVAIDRRAERLAVEWSDAGPHPTFADVPERRTLVRVRQSLERGDLGSPALGANEALTLVTSPTASDAGRRRLAAQCVVIGVSHEITGGRAVRTIELIAVSANGSSDPVSLEDVL